MIKSLSDLFTCISDFEMIPDDWCKGIIKPLHKSGSIYDLDNYRGITLTSTKRPSRQTLSKAFDRSKKAK
jgi:hypothetical protein